MLKKLMKYELMATGRMFLPLYAVLIIIAGFSWLLMKIGMNTPGTIGIIASVILIVGIFVLTLILTIQRFRQNLLSNEGHLMMTLPLKIDYLILCKLFVSSIWVTCSAIVVAFAILLMAGEVLSTRVITRGFFMLEEIISANSPQMYTYIVESVIFIVVSILFSALILYACMALSMLVNKNRGLFTFAAFIVISTAMQSISAFIAVILSELNITDWFENLIQSPNPFWGSQLVFLASVTVELAGCAVFYLITRYMLKNRLNLQ